MSARASFPPPRSLSLAELSREVPGSRVVGGAGVRVTGVHQDSRLVERGDLFAVRSGKGTSGALFVAEAKRRGAVALLVEAGADVPSEGLPLIEVDDVRVGLARAADAVYGHPTFSLDVVGITGTNGKTTTSHLAQAAIDGAGGAAALMGTIGCRFRELSLESVHTTPEADDFARTAAAMLAHGATHLVTEVSSHALAQRRVEAVRFRVAAFTNLTQDHLDFHGTMEEYARAKGRLFVELAPAAAAICIDDPFGAALARQVRAPLVRVSTKIGVHAEVVPVSLGGEVGRTRARVATPSGEVEIDSPLVGGHNLSNLLLALGIAVALDLDPRRAADALSRAAAVPGRLERCDGPGDGVAVFVDYAHTPDALERVLAALRPMTDGRLVCLFGCGGDRDPTKRAPMGSAVGRAADVAVVTSDNPRSEDPRAIIEEILRGLGGTDAKVVVEADRGRAIDRAILEAEPGDTVLLAGKGHETYQIVGAEKRRFDDRERARSALAERRAGRGDA